MTGTSPTGFSAEGMPSRWDEGLIIGSGSVGALLYGTPDRVRLTLAHEDFFLPANSRRPAPALAPIMPEVRRLLLEGDADAAASLLDDAARDHGFGDDLVWTDPLAPAATVGLRFPGAAPITGATRGVDYASGRAGLRWSAGGTGIDVSASVGRADHIVRILVSVDAATRVAVDLGDTLERRPGGEGVGAVDYGSRADSHDGGDNRSRWFHLHATGPDGEEAGVVSTLTADRDGSVEGEALAFVVEPDLPLLLTVRVQPTDDPSYSGPGASVSSVDAELGIDDASTGRRVTHGELFGRSSLRLTSSSGGTDARTDVRTDLLWARAKADHGDVLAERGVVENAYAAGRYATISSTGRLPGTLQGVWQGTWSPAWSADYTLNGNVQNGTIASLAVTGTPELMLSYVRLIDAYRSHYAENAERLHGLGGALLPARSTTHGRANHFSHDYPHHLWLGAGGWALRMIADYVSITGDADFAARWAVPFADEVTTFYEGVLVESGGRLHAVPSYSPENTPNNASTPVGVDATADIAIIADALRLFDRLADSFGDRATAVRARDRLALVDRLPDYRIADDGLLAEWIDPRFPDQLAHRHSSQLYPLWYEVDPAFSDTALRAAAASLVEAKLAWRLADAGPPPGRMEMAFGLVQLGLAAAGLGAAQAARTCAVLLARDHWGPSMVSTHDAGAIFNLDAAGGLPALIAAMAMTSTPGRVDLLPAWPEEWPTGTITGLRARGGILVHEISWDERALTATLSAPAATQAARTSDRLTLGFPISGVGATVRATRSIHLGEMPTTLRFDWSTAQQGES